MTGTRRYLLIGSTALLAAVIWASVAAVPEGEYGFRRVRGSRAFTLLAPGAHLRIPLLHEFHSFPAASTAAGDLDSATREGAFARLTYDVKATHSAVSLKSAAAEGLLPEEWLRREASIRLRESAGGLSGERIATLEAGSILSGHVASALTAAGLTDVSVTASAVAGRPEAVPASSRGLRHPLVLIGLDGADWQVADPLIDEGRLPNLARLKKGGAWGNLRSSNPMLSPLLWTTVVTGKPPDQHGIIDFLVRDPETGRKVPIGSRFRNVPALWNIFGSRDLTSKFVAWWATYPAEPVLGEMISDRVAYSLFDVDEVSLGLVHPPALWEPIRRSRVAVSDVTEQEIRGIADVGAADVARARALEGSGESDASEDRLVHLMKILASTRTYHDIAMKALQRGQPDLMGIYYQGIDEVSHRAAHCVAPALELCAPGDAAMFGRSIERFYEYQDELVGQVLAAIDPQSYVIVLSDHGFRNGTDRPNDVAPDIEGKPAKWHRQYGIVLIHGPGIEPGFVDNVTLLDVAPTVLRLAGLPAAADMTGRVLVEPAPAPEAAPAVASYDDDPAIESARRRAAEQIASMAGTGDAGEEEMLENLRSLGYIGGGESAAGPGPGTATDEPSAGTLTSHGNMGAVHMQNGEFEKAAREFEAALSISPIYYPALVGLADVRAREGRFDEALELVTRGMEKSRSPETGVYLRYASLAIQAGAAGQATEKLQQLRRDKPDVAEIPAALSIIAHKEGRLEECESLLFEALEIDPANNEAITRLMWFRRRAGDEERMEPFLRKALRINPSSVLHRNLLGLVLQKKGDIEGAESEFKEALAMAPDFGGTMANLGSLYGRIGRLEEAVTILTRALEIEPHNLQCRVNLGAALGKLGRTEESLQVLKAGMHGEEASPELLNALAVTYANRGDVKRAEELLRRSLAIDGKQPRIQAMLDQIRSGGG